MPKGQVTWITYQGETRSLRDWARRLEQHESTIGKRLQRGWSVRDALTIPARVPRHPAPRPQAGMAPHIAGPALAVQGQWVPLALWRRAQEDA